MTRIQHLLKHVLSYSQVEPVDVLEIKKLAQDYPIQDVNIVLDVNQAIKDQVDLEAIAIYLYSKYHRMKHDSERQKEDIWHELQSLNGPRTVDNHLDPVFIEALKEFSEMSDLVQTLKDIQNMVFGRQGKLEQLSVNYRRQMQADY